MRGEMDTKFLVSFLFYTQTILSQNLQEKVLKLTLLWWTIAMKRFTFLF